MNRHPTEKRRLLEGMLGIDEIVKKRIAEAKGSPGLEIRFLKSMLADDLAKASPPPYEPFSYEDYASGCLVLIKEIEQLWASGEVKAAIDVGIALGQLISECEICTSRLWRLGVHRIGEGILAAQATWGTPDERAAKKQRLLDLFKEAMSNGAKSQEEAYRIVAKKGGTSPRTIRRIVTGH
jgi:hypothetical protein